MSCFFFFFLFFFQSIGLDRESHGNERRQLPAAPPPPRPPSESTRVCARCARASSKALKPALMNFGAGSSPSSSFPTRQDLAQFFIFRINALNRAPVRGISRRGDPGSSGELVLAIFVSFLPDSITPLSLFSVRFPFIDPFCFFPRMSRIALPFPFSLSPPPLRKGAAPEDLPASTRINEERPAPLSALRAPRRLPRRFLIVRRGLLRREVFRRQLSTGSLAERCDRGRNSQGEER